MRDGEKAILVLEDGTSYLGRPVGARGRVFGEVVFNTSMTGYQEILTDPSYRGEIVVMTYPLIGNYGINEEDVESLNPHARGFVVKQMCDEPSNWRAKARLEELLVEYNIVGIEGVDTRALTRRLREHGTMRGVLAVGDVDEEALVAEAQGAPDLSNQDLVDQVTTKAPYLFAEGNSGPRITVVDFGAKLNILRSLAERDCRVAVVPGRARVEDVMQTEPDGVVLSNGPGDPKSVPFAVDLVKNLVGEVPVFGICLGHQILAHALGADTFRLKYGHRGANHPVKDLRTGRVYITSQNHGFAVEEGSWDDPDVVISHRNVNDQTVEGLMHKHLPAYSVQYHPEASPGPRDSGYLFDDFLDRLKLRV